MRTFIISLIFSSTPSWNSSQNMIGSGLHRTFIGKHLLNEIHCTLLYFQQTFAIIFIFIKSENYKPYLQSCDGGQGLSIPFGKRDKESRDISVTCCGDDLCNYPDFVPTIIGGIQRNYYLYITGLSFILSLYHPFWTIHACWWVYQHYKYQTLSKKQKHSNTASCKCISPYHNKTSDIVIPIIADSLDKTHDVPFHYYHKYIKYVSLKNVLYLLIRIVTAFPRLSAVQCPLSTHIEILKIEAFLGTVQ